MTPERLAYRALAIRIKERPATATGREQRAATAILELLAALDAAVAHADEGWRLAELHERRKLESDDAANAAERRAAAAEAVADRLIESVRHSASCPIYGFAATCTCDFAEAHRLYAAAVALRPTEATP